MVAPATVPVTESPAPTAGSSRTPASTPPASSERAPRSARALSGAATARSAARKRACMRASPSQLLRRRAADLGGAHEWRWSAAGPTPRAGPARRARGRVPGDGQLQDEGRTGGNASRLEAEALERNV